MSSSKSRRHTRTLSTRTHSTTLRALLLAPIVFAIAVLVGYTATATAPTLLRQITELSKSATKPQPLSASAPVSKSPMHRLSFASLYPAAAVVYTDRPNYFSGETAEI